MVCYQAIKETALLSEGAHITASTCPCAWGSAQVSIGIKPFIPPTYEHLDADEPERLPGLVAVGQSDASGHQDGEGGGDGTAAGGNVIAGLGHIYVVHFEPLVDRRRYLESVFFERWGLEREYVSFVTWCDSRTTPRAEIEAYYQPTNGCLAERALLLDGAPLQARWSGQRSESLGSEGGRKVLDPSLSALENSERMLGFELKGAQLCTAISHYDALSDMVANGYATALVLEDDAVLDEGFPALLQEYWRRLEPDWGVLFTDAATSCHWWERCSDLPPRRPVASAFKRSIPMGAFGGAILWNQRAARQLLETFSPFCLPWDMETEYHFLRHNTSIFFASPSLIVQGTFLNPDELGHTVSALRGERSGEAVRVTDRLEGGTRGSGGVGAGVGDSPALASTRPGGGSDDQSIGSLRGVRCTTFSFFDCTASAAHTWDECVAKRDACGSASADAAPLQN